MHNTFFMTHHAPVGFWSSFTFGYPGLGVSIDHESSRLDPQHDFVVALVHGEKQGRALPFFHGLSGGQGAQLTAGDFVDENERASFSEWEMAARWRIIPPGRITRKLSFATDRFTAEGIDLRVFTPMPPLPDPEKSCGVSNPGNTNGNALLSDLAFLPGILLQVEFDNSASDVPAQGYVGLKLRNTARMRPLDWAAPGQLCGVAQGDAWAMAAKPVADQVFTMRRNSIAQFVEKGEPVIHMGGNEGGILIRVPAATRRVLDIAIAFHHEGNVTQGLRSRYAVSDRYSSVEAVALEVLGRAGEIREACRREDCAWAARKASELDKQVFYQTVRAYYANTQVLLTEDNRWHYNVLEGGFLWRNTLDLAADHLPYELMRNPWVVRNLAGWFLERYSHCDQVTFEGERDVARTGGLSFGHDMGNGAVFAPAGGSAYELADSVGYSHMTTEQLLNGIYLFSGYALAVNDNEWLLAHVSTALDLLTSLENRDHYDPSQRTGIPKARSSRCGIRGHEITTYDCLDAGLKQAEGNLYIAVKAWCAALLLKAWLERIADAGLTEISSAGISRDSETIPVAKAAAQRASEAANRTAASLEHSFRGPQTPLTDDLGGPISHQGFFPANLLHSGGSLLFAALDPLSVPYWLGLKDVLLKGYPGLIQKLRAHAATCLNEGICIERETGGLRLSSGSNNTWPSKIALCLHSATEALNLPLRETHPSLFRELAAWTRESAAKTTIADQILSDKRLAINGFYYPRIVTTYLWMEPALKR